MIKHTAAFIDKEKFLENLHIGLKDEKYEIPGLVRRPCKEPMYQHIEQYLYYREIIGSNYLIINAVPESLLNFAGVFPGEAWEIAKKHTLNETVIQSFSEYMGINPLIGIQEGLYICTNKIRQLGASSILNTEALTKFAESKHADKIYILPSSTDEVILIPAKEEGKQKEELDNIRFLHMVRSINPTIDPKKRLSDYVYVFRIRK